MRIIFILLLALSACKPDMHAYRVQVIGDCDQTVNLVIPQVYGAELNCASLPFDQIFYDYSLRGLFVTTESNEPVSLLVYEDGRFVGRSDGVKNKVKIK